MECNFSFRHYKECLELALSNNYNFLRFRDFEKSKDFQKTIFMRHDIDLHIQNTVNVAKLEGSLGIKSTYFVRLCGKYNPFNILIFEKLKALLDKGHEIGLHYEPDFSLLNSRNMLEDIKFQIHVLENLFSTKIISICPHEPTRTKSFVLDEKTMQEIGAKYHAYSDLFLKQMKYISDSSCRWREGCMCEFIQRGVPKLCILTHPFWWYEKSPIENY